MRPSGVLTYPEFKQWWAREDRYSAMELTDAQKAAVQQVTAFFRHFDADASGSLDEGEFTQFHSYLASNGYPLPPVAECLAAINTDGSADGVSFNEYLRWMISSRIVNRD